MPESNRRRLAPVAAVSLVVALVLVVGAIAAIALRPIGADTREDAIRDNITERLGPPDDFGVRASVAWGAGELVLSSFNLDTGPHLAVSFTLDRGRGWRVTGSAIDEFAPEDVAGVGSLLVASSAGGADQPAWSAVYGILIEPRITTVEAVWSDDETGTGDVDELAFLVVRPGEHGATSVRYLDTSGAEVALVPVGDGPAPDAPATPQAEATIEP